MQKGALVVRRSPSRDALLSLPHPHPPSPPSPSPGGAAVASWNVHGGGRFVADSGLRLGTVADFSAGGSLGPRSTTQLALCRWLNATRSHAHCKGMGGSCPQAPASLCGSPSEGFQAAMNTEDYGLFQYFIDHIESP